MPRAKRGFKRRLRRKKILKKAEGFVLGRKVQARRTAEAVDRAGVYAYRDRRAKKRDFRQLWITRISAGCKMNGMNYSTFMHGLKTAGIEINRKMLSEMAINDPVAFTKLVEVAKNA